MLALVNVRCRVCRHRDRAAIETACEARDVRHVAFDYALSTLSLERHLASHGSAPISGVVARAASAVDDDQPDTLRSSGVAA